LKELQAVAEKHINEIDTGYDTSSSRKDPYEVSDPYDVSGLGYEVKEKHRYSTDGSSGYKYIDKSKYDVVPVKKIKSIKKLKSILKLTPEQAARLTKWQEEKNSGTYKETDGYNSEPYKMDD